jgi:hypothetical protein
MSKDPNDGTNINPVFSSIEENDDVFHTKSNK